MRRLTFLMMLIGIFAFVSCEKTDPASENEQELINKSAQKVLNFRAHLSGENEVPSVETMASGQVIFQLSKDGSELTYKLIVDSISNVSMAHIHLAPVGVNGKPVVWLYPSAPPAVLIDGPVEGILAEGVITKDNLINDLAGKELSSLIQAMFDGKTYVNVHTSSYPGGEIRGQVMGNMPQPNK